MFVRYVLAVACVVLACATGARAQQPYECSIGGGYLSGAVLVSQAKLAQQFRDRPDEGVRRWHVRYDLKGVNVIVGEGDANLWEFIAAGPEDYYIRAAEGKWKGYYLRSSDRAIKNGGSVVHLLELSTEKEKFSFFQVAK